VTRVTPSAVAAPRRGPGVWVTMMGNPTGTRTLDVDDVAPSSVTSVTSAASMASVASWPSWASGDLCDDGCPFCTGPETD
jgi:hypothetical protein